MTLVEIMIVVIIMALIATAVGVAVIPQITKAKVKKARVDCSAIAGPASMYVVEENECPSMQDLIDVRQLPKGTTKMDPWDTEYKIQCEGEDILVYSAGPDKQFGNEDDVSSQNQ